MRERIAEWKQIFDTEENAITKALSRMAWDIAAYSCLVEAVEQAPTVGGEKQLNGLLMDMVATGFWSGMMQGIRRLVEKERIRGPRSVCSLGGLIADIRASSGKLTRRVFVSDITGLEYNYLLTDVKREAYIQEQIQQGRDFYWTPHKLDEEYSRKRHAEFDWISGTTPGTSRPDDLIRSEVFDMLEGRLERLLSVVDHVNVEIAHAATEASRQGRLLERWRLSDAKQAIRDLAELANVVGNWFCYSGTGTLVPIPQYDQFAHLDVPLYTGDRSRLQEVWNEFDRESQQWHLVDPKTWMIEP